MSNQLINILFNTWKEALSDTVITKRTHFFGAGGDSMAATAMCLEVERQAGCAIPVGQVYLTPVLEDFAAALESYESDDRAPLFIPLKSAGKERPLFGIAPAMGGVYHFRELADELTGDFPFYIIEPRVSASGTHSYRTFRELAQCSLDVVKNKQPQGPYRFAGFSFGGPLAWEMARILEESGERVDPLILLDSSIRNGYSLPDGDAGLADFLLSKWKLFREFQKVRKQYDQPFHYRHWFPLIWQKIRDNVSTGSNDGTTEDPNTNLKGNDRYEMDVEFQTKLRDGYDPGTYSGKVHLFRSRKQLTLHRELDFDLGWTQHLPNGGPLVRTIQGDHFSLLKAPNVKYLAEAISVLLIDADHNFRAEVESEVHEASTTSILDMEEPVNGEALVDRFLDVVKTYPEKIALRDGGKRLTYRELHAIAENVAACILENDPNGTDPVLLHFQTSWQYICSLYGVLLAGRHYVPVDTDFPDLRIKEIITLSGSTIAISLDRAALKPETRGKLRVIPFSEASGFSQRGDTSLPVAANPDSPAALLFTSGSTGTPKGIVLSRKMLLHECWRRGVDDQYLPDDRYGMFYNSAFMGGLVAIHKSLLHGLTLCIYDLRKRGLAELDHWIREERITILHMITSIMRRFLRTLGENEIPPDLRILIPGGERVRTSDLDLWKHVCTEKVRFCTCLGSTECGTISYHPLTFAYEHREGPIPVGKPFDSLHARILKDDGTDAAPFEEGQLVITSEYIFRGYLNADELNKSVVSFDKDGKAIYKTGDFGFFDQNGVFYNAGRNDSRVKINGNLVELAEIESVLMRSGLVKEVAVIHRPVHPQDDDFQLVAFYRSAEEQPKIESRLGSYLLERLPRIMLPARWVSLSRFPETTNGKLDRRALAELNLMEKAGKVHRE